PGGRGGRGDDDGREQGDRECECDLAHDEVTGCAAALSHAPFCRTTARRARGDDLLSARQECSRERARVDPGGWTRAPDRLRARGERADKCNGGTWPGGSLPSRRRSVRQSGELCVECRRRPASPPPCSPRS